MTKKFLIVSIAFLLIACSRQEYPQLVKNDLLATCVEGILSDQTPVATDSFEKNNTEQIMKLCNFRLQEFMKNVDYSQYEQYQKNLYANFERAFRQKYVLQDIYNTLSPNDKIVFSKISEIMLGLDVAHEK